MPWVEKYRGNADVYSLNEKAKTSTWTKRGINGDVLIYMNEDNYNDLRLKFEKNQIELWFKLCVKKIRKKGKRARIVTLQYLTNQKKETQICAIRFKEAGLATTFEAKYRSLSRDLPEEVPVDDGDDWKNDSFYIKRDDDGITDYEDAENRERLKKLADRTNFRNAIKLNTMPQDNSIDAMEIFDSYTFDFGDDDKEELIHDVRTLVKTSKNKIKESKEKPDAPVFDDKAANDNDDDDSKFVSNRFRNHKTAKHGNVEFVKYSYGVYANKHEVSHYLSLKINPSVMENLRLQQQWKRPRLITVIILDCTATMNEALCTNEISKVEVCKDAITNLCRNMLHKKDKFCIITFNGEKVRIAYPLTLVEDLRFGMVDLRTRISKFSASNKINKTDIITAYDLATRILIAETSRSFAERIIKQNKEKERTDHLIKEHAYQFKHGKDKPLPAEIQTVDESDFTLDLGGFSNRILLLTDHEIVSKDKDAILSKIAHNANQNKFFTSLLSVGRELDNELCHEMIGGCRGCNYFSIQSRTSLMNKFSSEFDYMVSPVLYDLTVSVNTKINRVYNDSYLTYANDLDKGEVIKLPSLWKVNNAHSLYEVLWCNKPLLFSFDAVDVKKDGGGNDDDDDYEWQWKPSELTLSITYLDRRGRKHEGQQVLQLCRKKDNKESIGMIKCILLCRYVDLLKKWRDSEEQSQVKLTVNTEIKAYLRQFILHFREKLIHIANVDPDDDDIVTLKREFKVLNKMAYYEDTIDID